MKRLIKKAGNISLYHGTSAQRLFEIINSGSIGTDKYMDNGGDYGQVYLTNSEPSASRYGTNVAYSSSDKSMPDWPVVLEIVVGDNNLGPDMDDWEITNKENDTDNPTWQESLDETGQVVHEGEIPISQIKKIINVLDDSMYVSTNNCVLYNNEEEAIRDLNYRFDTNSNIDDFMFNWHILGSDVENYED